MTTLVELGAMAAQESGLGATGVLDSASIDARMPAGTGTGEGTRLQRVNPGSDLGTSILEKMDLKLSPTPISEIMPSKLSSTLDAFSKATGQVITGTLATTAVSAGVSTTRRMHQGQ